MPLVFRTAKKRLDHFFAHGTDFNATDEVDYEKKAAAFLSCPLISPAVECIRPQRGDRIRYNPVTEEFGVESTDGHIRTYFAPKPSVHGFSTNMDYFNDQCSKI